MLRVVVVVVVVICCLGRRPPLGGALGDDARGVCPRQIHVRHVREQLDALPNEVPYGRVYDQTQLQ